MSEKPAVKPTIAIDLDGTLIEADSEQEIRLTPIALPLLTFLASDRRHRYVLWTNASRTRLEDFFEIIKRQDTTLWAWLYMLEKHTRGEVQYFPPSEISENTFARAKNIFEQLGIKIPLLVNAVAIIDDEKLEEMSAQNGFDWQDNHQIRIDPIQPLTEIQQQIFST